MLARIRSRAREVRDFERPLVWFHAPSVGEGLQARTIMHALREARPELQLAYTFFSPSAERFAKSTGAEICDYLPFDGVGEADALLDALRPSLLVFVKLDVWPLLVARAKARRIPVALLSATVASKSGRLNARSLLFTRDAYAALDAVGAIDNSNAERLKLLGVNGKAIRVTGDTRFDQVWEKAEHVNRASTILSRLSSARPTLVAGSTWPSDESILFGAWKAVRFAVPNARLIIVPHEPTPDHVEPVLAWGNQIGLKTLTLDSALSEGPHADVVVVDQTGVLGELYALADVAFVGGGFHAAGLHSVIEPAAFGVPVLFGPNNAMSREAGLLMDASGGKSVATSAELAIVLSRWLGDVSRREASGSNARLVVERGLGATDRSVQMIRELLP